MKYLIFSDLDGTFLNNDTYSFGTLKNYINQFEFEFELIFVSSKTYEEIISIQKKININSPFIVENGASIFFPLNYFKNKIKDYKFTKYKNHLELRLTDLDSLKLYKQLNFYKKKYNFSFFMDLSKKKIREITNLKSKHIILSKSRKFSNPILWQDSLKNKIKFKNEIKSFYTNYSILEGGRFIHISDKYNKGIALKKFLEIKRNQQSSFVSISLGDSENDLPMFELTDFGCIIKSKSNIKLKKNNKNIYKSKLIAPDGWKESLEFILEKEKKNF